jgi:hypothetical protein
MSRGIGIIDPTIGASEYGANLAQWDWKPFSDAMSAAKTTYGMVRQNQEENLEQSITRALFPSAKKKAELDLKMLEADIKKTDAMTDYYLGRNDADGLASSSYGSSALLERIAASNPENAQLLAEISGRKKFKKEAAQREGTSVFNTLGNWR